MMAVTEPKMLSSPKAAPYPTKYSGYECEFFERPPEAKWLQTECPICLLVLREPYLISCCGHSFCRLCIERIKSNSGRCPLCSESGFGLMHNKGLERSLKEFDVKCTHSKSGCVWIGKLGLLDQHLNLNPESTKQLEGCDFAEIECIHGGCENSFERRSLAHHQKEECPMRPYCCNYCLEYEDTFEDVTTRHWPVCKCYPLSCPNNCSQDAIQRQYLQEHLCKDCPLVEVNCDFKNVGCDKWLLRKEMQAHLAEEQVTHLSLVNHALAMRLVEKDNTIAEMNREMERIKNEVDSLKRDLKKKSESTFGCQESSVSSLQRHVTALQHHIRVVPVQFTLQDFNEHRRNSEEWISEPFYTDPRGYKMCLSVDANGYGEWKGTHVSVFVHLMRGEFDNILNWPFRGAVTIHLLAQSKDAGHHARTVLITSSDGANRITTGERGVRGWGLRDFITHSELRINQFLKYDCVRFKVTEIAYF